MRKNFLIRLSFFNARLLSSANLSRYIITSLLLLQITICFGKQITPGQSLAIAQKFYQKHKSSGPAKVKSAITPTFRLDYISTDKPKTSRVKTQSTDSTGYFYVYNIGSNLGFIIVSGDDATKPVLAYSDDTTFPTANIPSNLLYWLDFYKSEIKYAQQTSLSTTLLDTITLAKSSSSTSTVVVQPLLANIKWDQTGPYNLLCPFSSTDNARSLTGCVATAMAQIMKYNQWPVKGTGSFSYTDGTNGTLTANFGNTTYDWGNMPDTYGSVSTTAKQDTAVATLMYQCGVSVSMTYSPSGSSALVSDAAVALKNYFGYDTDLNIYTRDFYSSTDWKNMIKTELNASRLVMYGGTTGTFGHAFVCDGYDSNDLFHINWGWSGYYNGYFELSVLNPPPSGSISSTGGFSQGQQIITGIQQPDVITNPSYLINMYSLGLTSTKSTITNIASQSFNVNFGFLNYGANDFNGKFGIGLYKDGVFQKTLSTYPSNVSLLANYGTPNFTLSGLSLSGLASGSYKIYCIFKPSTASSWTIMKGSNLLNNYLNVVVSGTTATITKPSLAPALALSQKITLTGKAYQNKTANFSVTVQNTGNEFYSNMGIKIYSTTNSSVYQYIDYGVVAVPTGETKTFTFSGIVTCAPGSYYATAVCDSTNAFSASSFKEISPKTNNEIPITILSQPAAAALSLTSPLSLSTGSSVISPNQNITLNANITNSGGYYDSDIIAFIFAAGGSSSIGYLDPKTVYIDTNESQSISFNGSLNLNPGNYYFRLYNNPTSWTAFAPAASDVLNFTIGTGITTANNGHEETDYQISPNPVKDAFSLTGFDGKGMLSISDIHGRLLLKKEINGNEYVSVRSLPQGVYILTLVTEKGTTERKMLKR
jgi:hypothetical protein